MSERPILLDLFCGAGGAAMGYHRAGFEVVGVDLAPQPNYPFAFIQADALRALDVGTWVGAAAIHASPPCQRFSPMTARHGAHAVEDHPDLVDPVRDRLLGIPLPFVIENVPAAPLRADLRLCGSMFGLGAGDFGLRRHRIFELRGFEVWPPASCAHVKPALGVYGHPGGRSVRDQRQMPSTAEWREGMGIDWMTVDELAEAIPPAYTEHIGRALFAAVTTYGADPVETSPRPIAPSGAPVDRTDSPLRPKAGAPVT